MVLQGSRSELRAQLAAIVADSDDGILTKTLDGVITSWNHGAEQLYGYTAREAIGQPVTLIIPPEHANDFPAIMARIQRGERVAHYETLRQHKDGHRLTVSVTVSPLRGARGRLIGASAIARDVSERQQQEAERATLIAALTHDIKGPLTTASGGAQLLSRQLDRHGTVTPEQLREGLHFVLGGTQRATQLLNELLDLTRLRAGEPLVLDRAACDLVALAQQVVATQQRASERHTLRLLPEVPTLMGSWDCERLERVLTNLVSNALKYSPEGGTVSVRLGREEEPPTAVLAVEDQGLGIPAADLPQIGRFFYRAGNVPHDVPGSGVGLASARQLVEQHGGTLSLTSTEGVGTTVIVRLPFASARPTD